MVEQANRAGQHMGNYRLVQLLGRGGFADVYLADHIHLNTRAAVKLLNTQLANDGIEGFRNEARMIASLVHPHIVRILDFGVENSIPYLVMDYAPNGTLRQRHPKGTRLPLQLVVGYVQQVAGALQYAHEQRLIHRDIKPENMLIGRNNEVLLSDFGIALVAQSSHYQSTQNIAGTIAYMAPEQIQAHPRPASDQYSLGIVVYEWLSGQRPFQGTMTEIAVKHATVMPPPLRLFAPDLPPAVEQVVFMALQKDPHNRFPSILAFAQALEQVSHQLTQPFAGGLAPASPSGFSTNRLPSSQPSQIQPPAQYGSAQPTPPTSSMPLPYPTYPQYSTSQMPPFPSQAGLPLSAQSTYPQYSTSQMAPPPQTGASLPPQSTYPQYSTSQISAPPQTGLPLPLPEGRRISRRTAIAALAGSTVAVVGSGLAYYAYTHASKEPSGLSRTPGSTRTPSSNTGTSSATSTVPLMTFKDHTNIVWAVSWSPNGKYIASASDDGTSHVWNVSTQERVLSYHSDILPAQGDDGAHSVAWMPDSTGIAIGFEDGTAQMVKLASHQQIGYYNSQTSDILSGILYAVAISPDGRSVALAGFFSYDIQIFDVATQQRIRTLSGHTDSVYSLAWSHNGKYIASGSEDTTARVWDWNSGKTLLIYDKQGDSVQEVSWSPDDARIVSGGQNGLIYIWTSDTGQTLLTHGSQDDFEVLATAWSHNGKYIASTGGDDGKTHIWNAQSGQLIQAFPSDAAYGLSWSPDDTRIATAEDNVVRVWQL